MTYGFSLIFSHFSSLCSKKTLSTETALTWLSGVYLYSVWMKAFQRPRSLHSVHKQQTQEMTHLWLSRCCTATVRNTTPATDGLTKQCRWETQNRNAKSCFMDRSYSCDLWDVDAWFINVPVFVYLYIYFQVYTLTYILFVSSLSVRMEAVVCATNTRQLRVLQSHNLLNICWNTCKYQYYSHVIIIAIIIIIIIIIITIIIIII